MYWICLGTEVTVLSSQVTPISQVVLKLDRFHCIVCTAFLTRRPGGRSTKFRDVFRDKSLCYGRITVDLSSPSSSAMLLTWLL